MRYTNRFPNRCSATSAKPDEGVQVVGGLSIQYTGHWLLSPLLKPAKAPADTTVAFSFGLNDVQHPKNENGNEFQGQLVVQINAVTKEWQTIAGFQYTRVLAVWSSVQL
jgi:hypothetical protein